ncbi:uncharacterized protein LOC112588299 [Harpegnathos saltator]|uniref:uncharacterized protein LOC112588299 n=1 Tax=Harpegnathos saltator TaxID=610380 RepID=UPI00058DDF9C|nr:uncharacterized protein LOC112588299 [Harpegnathos saltator]
MCGLRESGGRRPGTNDDLPNCRVLRAPRAFTHTGVDYAGSILVRYGSGRGHWAHKAYIGFFVCMTTKAIHLELVSDYSFTAFLAAYQRFIARRGMPTTIYSDNGTTFQGADREMRSAHAHAVKHPGFADRLATDGTTWRFIPPAAPHFEGLCDAVVRSVKSHLKRCVGSHSLSMEEMYTFLCRVEACLNSRPIAALSESIDNYQAMTPGHLLIGAPIVAMPEPSVLNLSETRLFR